MTDFLNFPYMSEAGEEMDGKPIHYVAASFMACGWVFRLIMGGEVNDGQLVPFGFVKSPIPIRFQAANQIKEVLQANEMMFGGGELSP